MAELITKPNLDRPDDVYQMLIDMHEGCSEQESHRRNAKLVLCLANHIGDRGVLAGAIEIASQQHRNS